MDWYFCTVNLSILLNLVFAFYFYLYSLDFFSEWFQTDVFIRNFNFSFWNFVFIIIERNYNRFLWNSRKIYRIFFIKKSFRFNKWLYNIQSTQKLHINCTWYILLILHRCIIEWKLSNYASETKEFLYLSRFQQFHSFSSQKIHEDWNIFIQKEAFQSSFFEILEIPE